MRFGVATGTLAVVVFNIESLGGLKTEAVTWLVLVWSHMYCRALGVDENGFVVMEGTVAHTIEEES
jgi:hypothetical protein